MRKRIKKKQKMVMNANYLEDLKDYYDSTIDRQEEYHWLMEELRTTAMNKFDHLIVTGLLSKRGKGGMTCQKVTVEERDGETIFFGWAKTRTRGRCIVSHFTLEYVEAMNKRIDESQAIWEAEEREYERQEKEKEREAKKAKTTACTSSLSKSEKLKEEEE